MTVTRTRLQAINATPFRDLIRGRVTARLDWPARLAAAGLPADVAAVVARVVRRTRLWRLERAAVADELIAHFADAIAAGATDPVAAFGDERAAAKLIRRAKRRNRPLLWHAWTWAWRSAVAVLLVYVALLLPAVLGRPRVSVDYVAELAAPARAVPESDRAWPLWRAAILACTDPDPSGGRDVPDLIDPSDDHRPDVAAQRAWLAAHADGLALARRAAAKPAMGYVVGPGGSGGAESVLWDGRHGDRPGEPANEVLLPYLNEVRSMAIVLGVDLARAADAGDGATVEADAVALHQLAGQVRRSGQFLVTGLVALGIDVMAVDRLGRAVADHPAVLSDGALVRLAHAFAGPEVAADLLDVSAERVAFADAVQRMYTDDGHGDGRMTWAGLALLPRFCAVNGPGSGHPGDAAFAVPFAAASRAEIIAAYDRLIGLATANLARPRRLADWATPTAQVSAWMSSPVDRVRYAALTPFSVVFAHPHDAAERYLGNRDGLLVGLALEAYHRRRGAYPAALGELVPGLLPAVPVDRITGGPVRYRLVAGQPVVYSVGADRTDDGGRRPVAGTGRGRPSVASWEPAGAGTPPADWVVFPPDAGR